MTYYEAFMVGTQAVNTANISRMTDTLHSMRAQQLSDAARQAHNDVIRQSVFEAAVGVDRAAEISTESLPAAYYLAQRAAPVLGPNGVPGSAFPSFQDKDFHSTATRKWQHVAQFTDAGLDPVNKQRLSRLAALDGFLPQLRAALAWVSLNQLTSNNDRIFFEESAIGYGPVLTTLFGIGIALEPTTGSRIFGLLLVIAGVYTATRRIAASRQKPALLAQANEIARAGGVAFTSGMTAEEVGARSQASWELFAQSSLGIKGGDVAGAKSVVDALQAERNTLWNAYFGSPIATRQSLPPM